MKMRARMSPPLSETPSPLLWLDCPTCQLCLCPRPPRTMLWTALPLSTETARGLVSSPPTQRGCPLVRGALCTAWRPLYKRSVCFWPQEFLWKMRNKKTFESWRNRRGSSRGFGRGAEPTSLFFNTQEVYLLMFSWGVSVTWSNSGSDV